MTEQWPPASHLMTYKMSVNLDHLDHPIVAEVSLPAPQNGESADISSFRYSRMGGDTAEDLEFRKKLYAAIGAVTVASGHAESAMKRVILVAEAKGETFQHVEKPWKVLVERLEVVASSGHEYSSQVDQILQWSKRRKIAERRNDVVHSYWWHWAGVGLARSRFTRSGETYTLTGNLEDLSAIEKDASLLFEYARRLDDIVLATWPQARFLNSDRSTPSAFRKSQASDAGESESGGLRGRPS